MSYTGEAYGVYNGKRSFNQMAFANTRTCWLSWAYNNILNKFPEIEYNLSELEDFVYNKSSIPMPIAPGTQKWGALRIEAYINSLWYDIFPENVERGSKRFLNLLDRGEMLMVTMNGVWQDALLRGYFLPTDRKTGTSSGHVVNIYKENWEYYILNSWYPRTNSVKLISLDALDIFKTREGAIYPMRTNKKPKK